MDTLKIQSAKLQADRHGAESRVVAARKEVRIAKDKEQTVSGRYRETVQRLLSDPSRLSRASSEPGLHLRGLREQKKEVTAAKLKTARAKTDATKEQVLLTKLSEKLKAIDTIRALQKKVAVARRENARDDELVEISALKDGQRVPPPLEIVEGAIQKIGANVELSEPIVTPSRRSEIAFTEGVDRATNTEMTGSIIMPTEVSVAKAAPGEVDVSFRGSKGEQVTLSVSQATNGSVSLSWRGFAAHSKEIQAVESTVLRKLRESGIRSSARRAR